MTVKRNDMTGSTLAERIDQALIDRLSRAEKDDADGNPQIPNSELAKLVEVAVKWESVKRESQDDFGSALGKGRTNE